jgi:hypothetical protein
LEAHHKVIDVPHQVGFASKPRLDYTLEPPVVPNQFQVGKSTIVHKPTNATFSFDLGSTMFKSIDWGRPGEQLPSGHYRRDDVVRVGQQLLTKLPK